MVDMVATRVFGPVDHATLDLGPAKHFLRIDKQQGDAGVALEVLEPTAIGPAVDPEGPVSLFEPDRHHLDAPIFAHGPDERREHLLRELLHFRTELDRHHATSHLNNRIAMTSAIASQTANPSRSPRTAQRSAPSRLMLRRALAKKVSGNTLVIGCNHPGSFDSEKKTPARNIIGNDTKFAIAATAPSSLAKPEMLKPIAMKMAAPMKPTMIR